MPRFTIDIQAISKGFGQVKQQLKGQLQAGLDSNSEAVNKLNARLDELNAEYKKVQSTLGQVSEFKKLKTDTAALGQEWQEAQNKIAALAREIKTTDGPTAKLKRSFNSQVKSARKLKQQYNENEVALEQMRRSLSSAGINTKDLATAQSQLKARLETARRSINDTGAEFAAAQKPTASFFTKARTGVSTFTERLRDNRRAAVNWSGILRSAFATAAGSAGIGYLINRQLSLADSTAKTADKIGFTTDALQELRFAGERSGVNLRTLDMGLQRFSRRVAEAASGSGELKDTLDKYDIAVRDASGNTRAAEDVLGDLAEAVKNAGSESEQLRIAFKAFDSEGAAMVNMLKDGRDGLDEYRASARRLGIVVEEDILRQSERATDRITDLKAVISSQLMRAIASLAPEIARITKDFTDWIRTQKNLGERLRSTVLAAWEWVRAIGSFIAEYGKWIAVIGGGSIVISKLTGVVLALNAAMLKVTGTGIIAWFGGYFKAAQAATVSTGLLKGAVSSLSTALISAFGAVTAFIGGWQLGKVIGEIDLVEKAVQGMYATIDEWFTKAQIKVLELSKIWGKLFGADKANENIDRRIDALKRHLDVIDRTREKIAAIDDSEKKAAESAIKRAQARMRAAMDEAQAEVDAEAKKRDANRETEEQEEDIYRKKQDRIQGRVEGLELALREEIAAIDLAEAQKKIAEEKAREERIQARRDFIREKLALVREELEKSVNSYAEETEEKLDYEKNLKKQIREMEIDLTQLRIRELETQTKAVKEADQEQEKSAREKYRERISFIREETEAQRDELAKQLAYIDDLEEEGVISHQEAVDRKIQAEMEFARAKVEQARKAAEAAKEIHGKESAEYQIAVNKEKQAAEDLADKKIESEKRAQEARKSLAKDFGAWLAQYSRETVAESTRTYSEFMSTMQAQMENINQFIYGKSMKQQAQLAGAVRSVQKAFEGTAEAVRDAYGVSIDYSNMTFEELQAEVAGVQNMFRGLMEDMRSGRANIDAIGQGISDWENDVSDVDIAMRDLTDRSSEFQAAWADLWSGSPKTVEETKAAIDRVKSAYSEMVKDGEAAISALMGEWDRLESKITSVEEQIRNLHADTADTIRELNRDLMTDEQAWLDERKQAHEVYNQAVSEMSRGNYEAANELFTEAKNLAKGLAREIQNDAGETVMTLEDTTSAAVDLIRRITEAQGGNLEQLKDTLEGQQTDIRSQIGYTQNMLESTSGKIAQINQQLKLSAQEIKEITNNLPPDWFGAGSDRHKFESGGLTMGPRHSAGGMDINVEGGEFIEPRPAVKKYGPMIFEAFRQLKIDRSAVDYLLSGGRRIMGTGGLVHRSIQAAAPRITAPRPQPKLVFAEGGPVGFAGQAPAIEKVHRVKFDFGRGRSYEGDFAPDQAEGIIRALKTAKLRSN